MCDPYEPDPPPKPGSDPKDPKKPQEPIPAFREPAPSGDEDEMS